jgi:hypothetical protein
MYLSKIDRMQFDHVEYNALKMRKFENTQINQKQRPVARKMIKYRTEKLEHEEN